MEVGLGLGLELGMSAAPVPGSSTILVGTGADDATVGTVAWNNPGNITADGGGNATCLLNPGDQTHYLKGTNLAFAVPGSAIINGVIVTVKRRCVSLDPQTKDTIIRLVKAGVVVGDNKADAATIWPSLLTQKTYGGSADLWGTTWTAAEINAANFGVVLSADSTTTDEDTLSVDFISITVHYTE